MKAQKKPAGNSPVVVHTSGHLASVAPGILEGIIEFPVRGSLQMRMERLANDRVGECARLICLAPYSLCDLVLIHEIDQPSHWWGQIPIEGYLFFVRALRDGKQMAIEFLDCKQPVWGPEAAELLA